MTMLKEKNTSRVAMLEESANYCKREKERTSLVPTMMKEEKGLAIKGRRKRRGFGNDGGLGRNVAVYIWVLW